MDNAANPYSLGLVAACAQQEKEEPSLEEGCGTKIYAKRDYFIFIYNIVDVVLYIFVEVAVPDDVGMRSPRTTRSAIE
jgi:hypothetical protein